MAIQIHNSDDSILVNQETDCSWDLTLAPFNTENALVYGGVVTWLQDYDFHVTAAGYYINGQFYEAPATDITLSPSDPVLDRIDVFYADINGQIGVLEGTPSETPSQPGLDLGTQIGLGVVFVEAGSTQPNIPEECLYQEDTEWTTSINGATINPASLNNPCDGTTSIEGVSSITGDYVQLTRSTSFQMVQTYNVVTFKVRPGAGWNTNLVNNHLRISFRYLGGVVGNTVIIDGQAQPNGFGLDVSDLTCQIISIPLSTFNLTSSSIVDGFRVEVVAGNSPFTWNLDELCIQGGLNNSFTDDDIHNQFFGPQTPGRFWIDGNARIQGYFTTERADPLLLRGESHGWGTTVGAFGNVFGSHATAGQYANTLGYTANAGDYGVAIGNQARATGGNVAIGYNAYAAGQSTALGGGAWASSDYSTAVGWNTVASGFASTVLGWGAQDTFGSSLSLGPRAVSTAPQQVIIGSQASGEGYRDIYFGHGYQVSTDAGSTGQATTYTLNVSASKGTNKSGGTFVIAASKGTGTGALNGGINFQTADVTVSGSDLQTLSNKFQILKSGQLVANLYGDGTFEQPHTFVLGVDANGNVIEIDGTTLGGGVSNVTANNGITENVVDNFQWGGTLIQDTTIDGDNLYRIFFDDLTQFLVLVDTDMTVNSEGDIVLVSNNSGNQASFILDAAGNAQLNASTAGYFDISTAIGTRIAGRFEEAKGANIASANNLTLGLDGNLFTITGNVQLNAITTANWQAGSTVGFVFTGAPLIKHNTVGGGGTAPLLLAGSTDFQAAAGDYLELRYDGLNWHEVGRKLAAVGSVGIVTADNALNLSSASNVQWGGPLVIPVTTITFGVDEEVVWTRDANNYMSWYGDVGNWSWFGQFQQDYGKMNFSADGFNYTMNVYDSLVLTGTIDFDYQGILTKTGVATSITDTASIDLYNDDGSNFSLISLDKTAPSFKFKIETQSTNLFSGIYHSDGGQFFELNTDKTLLLDAGLGVVLDGSRFNESQGLDANSANDFTLGLAGNFFHVLGTTQINAITNTNWWSGATITLAFNSSVTVKHNTAGGAGTTPIFLAGATDFAATTNDLLVLIYDASGPFWREKSRKLAAVAPGVSADNGLTENVPNNIQLFGTPASPATLLNDRQLNMGAFTVNIQADGGSTAWYIQNVDQFGGAFVAQATDGLAIGGTVNDGTAVQATSVGTAATTFISNAAGTEGGLPAWIIRNDEVSPDARKTLLRLERRAGAAGADGVAGSIDFHITSSTGSNQLANRLSSTWTTAANATRTSQFKIEGVSSATTQDIFTISGGGSTRLNKYGIGTFTGTPATYAAWDANGNMIELSSIGEAPVITADNGLTKNTATNVRLGGTLAVNTDIASANFTLSLNADAAQTNNIFQTKNQSAAIRARITDDAAFSNTGGQTGSEIFGDGASVSGINSVVIGNTASGTAQDVVIGDNTSSTGGSKVLIGHSATTVGANPGEVIIGSLASSTNVSGGNNVVIGTAATTAGGGLVGVGYSVVVSGTNSVGIGNQAVVGATHEYSQAYGAFATTTAANQLVFGSATGGTGGVNDAYFGRGVTSVDANNFKMQPTGASGTNMDGNQFTIAGSKATGDAIPGDIRHQTSVVGSSGTTLQTLGDRYSIIGKYTTLTESAATSFARVNVPSNTVAGGELVVTVEANDATDFQARTLRLIWSAVNKAGTTTITISTPEEAVAVSAGTLTVTITAVDSGSGNVDFQANAVSSLTQTVLRANAQVTKNFGTGTIIAQ